LAASTVWNISGTSVLNGKSSLSKAIVLDTSIIINFLDGISGIPDLYSLVKEEDCFVSIITRMELLKYPAITTEDENRINRFLSNVVVIPIDDSIEQETIQISRKTKLFPPHLEFGRTLILCPIL
jgi:hypothetical protein